MGSGCRQAPGKPNLSARHSRGKSDGSPRIIHLVDKLMMQTRGMANRTEIAHDSVNDTRPISMIGKLRCSTNKQTEERGPEEVAKRGGV